MKGSAMAYIPSPYNTPVNLLYLGNKALIDTTQGNNTAENAASLLGTYTSATGLAFQQLTPVDMNGSGDRTMGTNDGPYAADHWLVGGVARYVDVLT
jgi:hypothetical protein